GSCGRSTAAATTARPSRPCTSAPRPTAWPRWASGTAADPAPRVNERAAPGAALFICTVGAAIAAIAYCSCSYGRSVQEGRCSGQSGQPVVVAAFGHALEQRRREVALAGIGPHREAHRAFLRTLGALERPGHRGA